MAAPEASRAVELFGDWRWRLNNLYWITNKEGRRVRFELNWAQEALFREMHFLNVILKARQLGFTTFIALFGLDQCLFNADFRAGFIADTLENAKALFADKIRFPYDNLPDGLRAAVPVRKASETQLLLRNNSGVRVGVSLRGGTLNLLHVSEYGKICAKAAHKAREIRTGALNTLQAGQVAFIESTAEGQEGHFFELSGTAQALARTGTKLSLLDWKFHFAPWWREPAYVLDPAGVTIADGFRRYFARLEAEQGIALSPAQQAWYAKKAEVQLGDMKREYPSTPAEAFEAAVEGAYYGELMARAEHEGRVGRFKADPAYLVHTAWDIGRGDYTAIWFFQVVAGRIRVVGYFQNTGEGLPYYAGELERLRAERGWTYGTHLWPHDGRVTEWGSDLSRVEQGFAHGLKIQIAPSLSLADGINAVRAILPRTAFDAEDAADGVKAAKAYRKSWDDEHGIWLDRPCHDWSSHGADALRMLAVGHGAIAEHLVPVPVALTPGGYVAVDTRRPTFDELMAAQRRTEREERL